MAQLAFILISLLDSCIIQDVKSGTDPNNSIIITSINYHSYGIVGYGGSLVLRNKITNQLYLSLSRIGFDP
jgi:hypothetical protein